MRFVKRTLTAIAVALGVLLTSALGHADPLSKPAAPEARSHLALGNKLYGVRSFDEAAAEYKAGAIIEPAPVFDYNLGQCFRQLGKYQEAIWHYDRFLSRGNPQGELLDAVTGFITQMKSELDKKAMTQKPTEPAPSGASAAPIPIRLESPQERSSEAWYDDRAGWALTGAGVVGLAVGGGLLVDASSLRDDANRNLSQQEQKRLADRASTRELLGELMGAGGVGLLVVGVIKLAIHPGEPPRVARWNIGTTHNSLLVFGEF